MARETRFKRLDVRPLIAAGVEPLPRIRRTLQALKPDQGLVVLAPFLPSPLIEFLGGEDCDNCVVHCPDMAVKREGDGYLVLTDYCKGCGLCVKECPTGSMKMVEEAR